MGAANKGAAQIRWGDNTAVTLFAGAILTTGSTAAPESDPGNQSSWEINAGGSITLSYADTAGDLLKAAAPQDVIIIAYYETGTGTIVRTFQSSGPPPSSITFFGTDTGAAGGVPKAGTVRIYMRLIKANAAGGIGNYDVDTDGNVSVGSITEFHPGAVRSNFLVNDLTVSAYPAGSTFAYGAGANENLTLTAVCTPRFADRDVETVRLDSLDVTAQQAAGVAQEMPTGSGAVNATQVFTANSTFDDAAKSYGVRLTAVGNSLLLTAELWALPVDNGSNVTQDGTNAVKRESFYNVDPRISITGVTFGQLIYNRGEVAVADFGLRNARVETITRSMTARYRDSGGTIRGSVSDTGANYDLDYTIGSGDGAAADFVGSQWTVEGTAADVATPASANVFKVSSKYNVDVHPQLAATLSPDDWPTQDANEQYSFVILGDVMYVFVHLRTADLLRQVDTSGNAITLTLRTPGGATSETRTADTASDGWTTANAYNPGAPAGNWTIEGAVAFNGNTGTDTETVTYITPLTSNLKTRVLLPPLVKPGQTITAYLVCEVDDVLVVPQTLPQYRVGKVAGGPVTLAGLAPWAAYDYEAAGPTLLDVSGNGWHATGAGSPTYNLPGARGGLSWRLNGQGRSATFGLGTNGDYSFTTWYKPDDTAACNLMECNTPSSPSIEGSVATGFRYYNNNAASVLFPVHPVGEWHHYAVTFGGGSGKGYFDGVLVGSFSETLHPNSSPIYLNSRAGTSRFAFGSNDETGVWKRALSATEITAIYEAKVFSNHISLTNMVNAVNGTATINGTLYRATFTAPSTPGTYEFWTKAQLNGNGIRDSASFRVAGDAFDPTGLFAGPGVA